MDIRFIIRHDHGYQLHYTSRPWTSASLYVTTTDIRFFIRHDHGYPLLYTSRPWISASLYVTTMDIRFIIRHDRGYPLHYTSRRRLSASLYVTTIYELSSQVLQKTVRLKLRITINYTNEILTPFLHMYLGYT